MDECISYHIPQRRKLVIQQTHDPHNAHSALRSGITVVSEVYPRRGYCWLKTFPNTPQDDLKYSRLCNFWRLVLEPTQKSYDKKGL